mmetsp:Transcript_10174/g.25507  ORF Transcript_10174/g.25507 Transcript_10174/m.25507 type:complete len:153 (+) Transcript_10174:224-682(+)|eukprot:CAMPEP_0177675186 /NCGR_PEP_ID=MMETSP0447-20121125/27035_1 /TAXON_ID=0 /ORGANISM="Stygamoeba regulata, Strain BSH-02190019" /LENGTH=152 /DNA_ID=CAMNT_0019183493 /DNA_START=213 /DNA_END=671 /DNA_ORIENTATION=+
MKVMVCVDGSAPSERALRFALRAVGHNSPDDELFVVNVPEILAAPHSRYSVDDDSDLSAINEARIRVSQDLINGMRTELTEKGMKNFVAESICEKGNPKEILLRLSKSRQVDLLVTGSRSHTKKKSSLQQLFVGSTSNYLVDHCKCSVVVVR